MFTIKRLDGNPIIRPGMAGLTGEDAANINGPSLIRVPPWAPNRRGAYYLYFAHHKGKGIRLAYADALRGPWRIHPGGVLPLERTPCRDHVASPDVHVDEERHEIRMYFHGVTRYGQRTFVATSPNGLDFTAHRQRLGPFYFRVFRHRGRHYAVAKHRNACGVLLGSRDPCRPFRRIAYVVPGMRHAAVHVEGDTLLLFFSVIGDDPESILLARMNLSGPPRTWRPGEPVTLLAPEEDWEGADLPPAPSRSGPASGPVRQVRDPAYFEENGERYLLYSVAGEQGIALARLGSS
jgi:hypothetical protein